MMLNAAIFSIFQRKFHILVKDFELWFIEDIMEIVECCIILHNMMVSVWVACNEEENSSWYECNDNKVDDTDTAPFHDPDLEYVEQSEAELALHHWLELEFYNGPAVNLFGGHRSHDSEWNTIHLQATNRWWEYSMSANFSTSYYEYDDMFHESCTIDYFY
jgi:hypothetical protein